MNKIDRRIAYSIVVDTETCPVDKTITEVRPDNMWVYDIGWVITDKRGTIYKQRSFVNADIFLDEKELMKSAYYAEKIPKYWNDIKSGKRILTSFYNIRKAFLEDIQEYKVCRVFAHNMFFDNKSLNTTLAWLTKSKFRYFFPKGVEICDTLKMCRDVVAPTPTYQSYCKEHGYLTKNGKPRLTAEIVYRFISGKEEFEEEHTGLADVKIEVEIMAYCYRKHKKMRKQLFDTAVVPVRKIRWYDTGVEKL